MKKALVMAVVAMATGLISMVPRAAAAANDSNHFRLVVSAGAATCLPTARGDVTVSDLGPVQNMHIEVSGLPANKEFAAFLLQVPHSPFGLVWYEGDVVTDARGRGVGDFTGIFSRETFINGPGPAPAPAVFPDNATVNPATAPIQVYHMGLWFTDPIDASNANCPATPTQFDGDHRAGIQVLNTTNFPDDKGPLSKLK